MPSAKRAKSYHPGLVLAAATLAGQFTQSRGATIPRRRKFVRRDRQVGKGGGDTTTDTDSDDTDDSDDDDKPPNHSKTSTSARSTSTPATASHTSSSLSHSSSQSSSANSTIPTSDSAIANVTRPISTGGIIGAVVGSLIIAGLLLMVLAQCIRRSRKARKRPQGFIPSDFFAVPPHNSQDPQTEMSQTQSSPLISSAIAAGATSSQASPIISSRHSHSYSSNPTSSSAPSLSPHILASPDHSRSLGRNSDPDQTVSGGISDGASSAHEPLHSPYESPLYSLAASSSTGLDAVTLPLIGAAAFVASQHGANREESGLYRAMIAHQKSLESNAKAQEGHMQTNMPEVHSMNDPPPRYDA